MPRRRKKRQEQDVPKEDIQQTPEAQEHATPSPNSDFGSPVKEAADAPADEAVKPAPEAEAPAVPEDVATEDAARAPSPKQEEVPPSPEPLAEAPETAPEASKDEAEKGPEGEAPSEVLPQETPTPVSPGTPAAPSGPSPWPAALLSSLVAFVFAVVVTLGVLSTLNRGLLYARPADVGRLATRVQDMEAQLAQLQERVTTLQGEVDALKDLGVRVDDLEAQTQTLAQDVEEARTQVQTLGEEVGLLRRQQRQVFSFFEELRRLLDSFFGPSTPGSEGTPTPESAPEATP